MVPRLKLQAAVLNLEIKNLKKERKIERKNK